MAGRAAQSPDTFQISPVHMCCGNHAGVGDRREHGDIQRHHGILIRSLPFRDSSQLVWIKNQEKGGPSAVASQVFTFRDLKRNGRLFSDMAAFNAFSPYFTYNLTCKGDPERLAGVDVSET